MQLYLVGGAVRDELLQLPVTEHDWVVVGATPELMLAQGYQPVGKDFPVFLHPVSKEEYALARTERKIGPGYKGFTCSATPSITLSEDLSRRDLTINAMAKDTAGAIIDPFGGCRDLAARLLRHVSSAFIEDPVRVLRLARFAARFAKLGFTVAPETQKLIRHMSAQGELAHLVVERVWQETQRALTASQPQVFFEVLKAGEALASIFPELDNAACLIHCLQNLHTASNFSPRPAVRWASLLQLLNHELVRNCCTNLRVPRDYTELACLAAKYRSAFQTQPPATTTELLYLLTVTDAFRRPQRFHDLLTVWRSNGQFSAAEHGTKFWLRAQQVATDIDITALTATLGLSGEMLKAEINAARLNALNKLG